MKDPFLGNILGSVGEIEPVEVPSLLDWRRLESELHVTIPDDLQELHTALGNGHFGELWLFNPCSSSPYTKFTKEISLNYCRDLGGIAEDAGFTLYPAKGGFLRIGASGNRMDLLLLSTPEGSLGYKLAWFDQDRSRRGFHAVHMPVAEFLFRLFSGDGLPHWSKAIRNLVWEKGEKLFSGRPGTLGGYRS